MFTTGEFSRIARVPRRTLRHYREIGLFMPIQSDIENGYHYYSVSQLPQLHRILALRDLGLSLDQIQRALQEDISPAELRGMLQMKKADIEKLLLDELRRIRAIESRLELLDSGEPALDVVLKDVPGQPFYATTFECHSLEHGQEVIQLVTSALPEQVGKRSLGQMMTLAHSEDFTLDGVHVDIGFIVEGDLSLSETSIEGMTFSLRQLPAVNNVASVVLSEHPDAWHKGSEALGFWIEANQYNIVGFHREVWQQLPTIAQPPIVELQVPVRKQLEGGLGALLTSG